MEISHDPHKMSHGVDTLMYVGDVDDVVDDRPPPTQREVGLVVVGALAAIFGSGTLRLAGYVTAGYVGYKICRYRR